MRCGADNEEWKQNDNNEQISREKNKKRRKEETKIKVKRENQDENKMCTFNTIYAQFKSISAHLK